MDPQPDKAVLHTNCAQRLQDQAAFVERVTYRWMVPQQCGQSFLWSLASCWDSWESEISICPWMSLCFPASSSPSPLCVESVQPSPPWRHCGLFYPAMCFHNFFSGNELFNSPLFLSNLMKAGLGIQSLHVLGMANRQTNTCKQQVPVCLLQTGNDFCWD